MNALKIITGLLLIALTTACKLPLQIDGYGRVQGYGERVGNWYGSAGSSSMYFYNNDVSGAYDQTWIARDRDGVGNGWDFVGWEGWSACEDRALNQTCRIQVSANDTQEFYGERAPALEAVFGLVHTLSWNRPTERENGASLSLSQIARYEISYTRQNAAGEQVEKVIEVNGNQNNYSYRVPIPRNVNRIRMVTVDTSGRRSDIVDVSI